MVFVRLLRIRAWRLAVLAVAATAAASDIRLPDPKTGSIDGVTATLIWPARYKSATQQELLPIDGCRVNMTPAGDRDAIETHPCGIWIRPRPGLYKVWLEGPGFISPFGTILRWEDMPFDGRGALAVSPVVPSGSILLANDAKAPEHGNLRLFALESQFFGNRKHLFDRRIADARTPTAVPAGRVVAGWFDRRNGNATALTPPITVGAGKSVSIHPLPPERDSDVLVILQRPVLNRPDRVELFLEDAKKNRPPDVFAHGTDSIYAVWYGVSGRSAQLTAKGEALHLDPAVLSLSPRAVTTYRARLAPLPRLSIRLDAPSDVFRELHATVRRLGAAEILERVAVAPGETHIESVPVGRVRVMLTADEWEFTKDIDVRADRDAEVDFVLRPLVVRGTVYAGRDPAAASVAFLAGNDKWIATETDDTGRYSLTLWEPAAYIAKIDLAGDPSPPFVEVAIDVGNDTVVDFHVPRNAIRVKVTDEATGAPIAGATVMITSDWGDGKTVSNRYGALDDGTMQLPRLHPGRVAVAVTAPGYEDSDRRELEVEATTERELAFPLKRAGILARTRLILPDGAFADGAEACLIRRADGVVIWRGLAKANGMLEITGRDRHSTVVIRHPRAASVARDLRELGDSLVLPSPAPPLVLRTTDGPSAPASFALVSVWLDGIRLTDASAAFATWSPASMSGPDALWSGRNLPAGPVRVLVTRRVSPAQIMAGAYDSLARTITYPWQTDAIEVSAMK